MSKAEKLPTGKDLAPWLIPYMECRINRELQDKKSIEENGEKYFGVLSMLQDQLESIKDGSYWKEKDRSVIDIESKRKEIDEWNAKVIGRQAKIHHTYQVNSQKSSPIKESKPTTKKKIETFTVKDEDVDDLVEQLHQVKIHWAESLEDIDQRQAWLTFYKVCAAQDRKKGEYWRLKREAVKRTWVLEMNGLLPHQNGEKPPMEERRRIWDENYGK